MMKRTGKKSAFIIHIGMVIFLLATASLVNAQNSDFISWETTARDATGQPISNQAINVQAVLHFGTPTAISSYVESHRATTNSAGIFKIEVGDGIPVAGSYENLPWGKQDSFIEISINGVSIGTNEIKKPRSHNRMMNAKIRKVRSKTKTNSKAAQINPDTLPIFQINVGENTLKAGDGMTFTGKKPVFTINAKDKVTITAGEGIEIAGAYPNYTVELKKHFIGEEYRGGTVFYVEDNGQHGLIAGRFYERSTWSNFELEPQKGKISSRDFKTINNWSGAIGAGKINTMNMVMQEPIDQVVDMGEAHSIPYFLRYEAGHWYVPSLEELHLVYKQRNSISSLPELRNGHILWSSTEGGKIWKGHGDRPDGGSYASGQYFKDYMIPVKIDGKITGVRCINFFTGKEVTIAKVYINPFILIREF